MASVFRDRLPATSLKNDTSIWSVLKTCVGKDLSKITMPIQFNEPLSFLQRLAESLEYSNLLSSESLSSLELPEQRLEMVAAFAVSSLAANWNRTGKPFNPLLHETYELVRDGYKLICEQVSHHPPISAFHAESDQFVFQGWIHPKLKLWGKSVEIHPKGVMKLTLKRWGETYSWNNVNCTVHNVIVGKLWIEHHGTMEITCPQTDLRISLNFKPGGWFQNEQLHRFEGFVVDGKKNKLRYVYGKWTECLRSTDVESYENFVKNHSGKLKPGDSNAGGAEAKRSPSLSPSPSRKMLQKFNSLSIRSFSTSVDASNSKDELSPEGEEEVVPKGDDELVVIPNSKLLWQVTPRPEHSPSYYNFTLFAMSLNQRLPDVSYVATDSRLRPDIRHLEEGAVEQAGEEKTRLEERQRKELKNNKGGEAKPNYFEKTSGDDWRFLNNYWTAPKSHIKSIFD